MRIDHEPSRGRTAVCLALDFTTSSITILASSTVFAVARCTGCPARPPFPEQTAWVQDHDDGFFPLRRHYGQLDFARLDIEHGIRRIPLREEHLLLRGRQRRFAIVDLGEEVLRIKRRHRCDSHGPHVSV